MRGATGAIALCLWAGLAQAQDGNSAPEISIFVSDGAPFRYQVVVTDAEDGDSLGGGIDPSRIAVLIGRGEADGYVFPLDDPAAAAENAAGERLIDADDCVLCHRRTEDTNIPGYRTIARLYEGREDAREHLARRIREGGSGTWGETVMTPHLLLSDRDADLMAGFVLSMAAESPGPEILPVSGAVDPDVSNDGRWFLAAGYRDSHGALGIAYRTIEGPE